MAGSAPSIDLVPLRDVLPSAYVAVEDDLRRLARDLENHEAATGRTIWHWYPERAAPPQSSSAWEYRQLLSMGVVLVDSGVDWLELTLDIAFEPELTLTASVGVACWCPQNHNAHYLNETRWLAPSPHELIDAMATAAATLTQVLNSGPFDPSTWRVRAGLPPPEATR